MLVTRYKCNTLYVVQKSPKLKPTVKHSLLYLFFYQMFTLSTRKPVNVFYEQAISLKTYKYNIMTFRYIIPKLVKASLNHISMVYSC